MPNRIIGIFREKSHSPNRELDDYEILRKTSEHCSAYGHRVSLFEPEDFLNQSSKILRNPPDLFFIMCEEIKILEVLKEFESKGSVILNSVSGVLNTYRHRTVPLLESSQAPFPKSEFVSTLAPLKIKSNKLLKNVWVKRGDFHNTQTGDVVFARGLGEIEDALRVLSERGVLSALLQEHIDGDLIKFYGIGNSLDRQWFRWFYHKGQALKNFHFSEEKLKQITFLASRALELEIYGGDAIVDQRGEITIIDLNAWPSFALFRTEASSEIARHLNSKIENRAKVRL